MPARTQKYFGIHDLYEEMAKIEAELAAARDRQLAANLLKSVRDHIRCIEGRIDFERERGIDTPSKIFHKLELYRAYRAILEKIICPEKTMSPPTPQAGIVGSTGGSVSPKAAKASKSSFRTRSAKSSTSAGLTK